MPSPSRGHDMPEADTDDVVSFSYLKSYRLLSNFSIHLSHFPTLEEGVELLSGEEGIPGRWVMGFGYGEHRGILPLSYIASRCFSRYSISFFACFTAIVG